MTAFSNRTKERHPAFDIFYCPLHGIIPEEDMVGTLVPVAEGVWPFDVEVDEPWHCSDCFEFKDEKRVLKYIPDIRKSSYDEGVAHGRRLGPRDVLDMD